jgi:HAD superfamily hydrolase (TIGR01459 family)
MGITVSLYDKVITSGETAYQCLGDAKSSYFKPAGKNYFYIGLEKDRKILNGLDFKETDTLESANFILLAHTYHDNQPLTELLPLLESAVAQRIPALCINPDHEVVRLNGDRIYCAGVLAEEYRMIGGEVIYFGKPHSIVYKACLETFAGITSSRVVAIGDNLSTDIAGASIAELPSVLVTGGILRERVGDPLAKDYQAKCEEVLKGEDIKPTYIVPTFNW